MTMETPPRQSRVRAETPEKVSRPVCSAYIPPNYVHRCGQPAVVQVLLPNGRAVPDLLFCAACFNQPAVAALYAQQPRVWLR